MNTCRAMFKSLTLMIFIIAVTGLPARAQDPLLINYQGRLTDSGGDPLDTTVSITFTLNADSTPITEPLWQETHASVEVAAGLFSVVLGSETALPDNLFNGRDLYLGIAVGADPETTPRTLLTSVPAAAYSRRVAGDIVTQPGMMLMSNENGDSAFALTAGALENVLRIGWDWPPDPYRPAVEVGANENTNFVRVNAAWPPDPHQPAFEVLSNGEAEAINVKLGAPPDPCIDMAVLATDGASINVYDEIGKVMGVEPTPFNEGHAIKLFDPTQVIETELVEISSSYGESSAASMKMYSTDAADPTVPEIELMSDWTGSRVTVGLAAPPDPIKAGVEMTSDGTTGMMKIGGGQPAPAGQQMIVMSADLNSAKVGIGTDSPAEALDVIGNAHIDGTLTWQAKTSYLSVPAAAFSPGMHSETYYNYHFLETSKMTGVEPFRAPVHLPHGATVTKVSSYWDDETWEYNSILWLFRNEMTFSVDTMAMDSTFGDPGYIETYDDSIDFATIDNSTYAYYLYIWHRPGIRFYGAVIEYEFVEAY